MKKNNRLLFSCASYCAWQCLKEREEKVATVGGAADVIHEMLLEKGVQGFSLPEMRRAFIQEILRILLNEANANFGYPHTDAALETSLLPLWSRQFERLERPLDLARAFDAWIADNSHFPPVAHILGLMPAQKRHERPQEERGEYTPGLGRKIYEQFMEENRAWKEEQARKCRIIKFAEAKKR